MSLINLKCFYLILWVGKKGRLDIIVWNPDDQKKDKRPVMDKPRPITVSTEALLAEFQLFKHVFTNSSLVRKAHGYEKKDGKIILVDDTWSKTTVDKTKLGFIKQIMKEQDG